MDNYNGSTFFIGEVDPTDYNDGSKFTIDANETAVVFISRCGGEGLDLSTNLKRDAQTAASQAVLNGSDAKATNAQKKSITMLMVNTNSNFLPKRKECLNSLREITAKSSLY